MLQKNSTDEHVSKSQISKICAGFLAESTDADGAAKCVSRARALAERFPDEHEPALTLMLVLEMRREPAKMFERWMELSDRFPDCKITQRHCVRWMYRLHKNEEAIGYIKERCKGGYKSPQEAIHCALLHEELKDFESSDAVLQKAIEKFPRSWATRIAWARSLKGRGKIARSWSYFMPKNPILAKLFLRGGAKILRKELLLSKTTLDRIAPEQWQKEENTRSYALKLAILMYENRKPRELANDSLGPVSLITGSLATGGAERQMVNTTINLEKRRKSGEKVNGITLQGPFEIAVTTLSATEGKAFFLPVARAGGIDARQIKDMHPEKLADICPENRDLAGLLPILPQNAIYGVQRLVAYFKQQKTDVAYLWQDGAIVLAALAALIAGVPRIVINVRGLPPNLRRHLFREEYPYMYRSLAKVPGVCFASNGHAATFAYGEWLDIDPGRFFVIPNGIAPMVVRDEESDNKTWADFKKATKGASHTVGGVFRFETDKRPLLWIEFARDYFKRQPDARFVLVGSGKYWEEARARAKKYGIDHRFLFVGESTNVPFWLTKLDIFLLLSQFEGLPNVLIEAQMMGVPVVSTPAGSAEDTFIDGETGFILSEVENPTTEEMCDKVEATLQLIENDKNMRQKAQDIANEKFSIETMVRNTVKLLTQDI